MMNRTILLLTGLMLLGLIPISAQRFSRPRPLTIEDEILMKLDSIDMIYFSRFRGRDKFEAKRKLDRVAQLVNALENQVNDRERSLRERERALIARERELEYREREWDREYNKKNKDWSREHNKDWEKNRDRDRDRDRDRVTVQITPMGPEEFGLLMGTIEKCPFAQDKKNVLKTASISNFFLIEQVIKIAGKFTFDADKLEVIQLIYPRILDPDKNYMLYNCFTFSDSKNKLERFIQENTLQGHPQPR